MSARRVADARSQVSQRESSSALGVQRASAPKEVLVYVDGVKQPIGAEALRSIRASSVDEVRYLEPTVAANELGPLAAGGALLLKLRATQRTPPPV